jgi:hypothetical protein
MKPTLLTEEQIKIRVLSWEADAPTQAAIERQAKLMGFKSPQAYLKQAIAAVVAANESDTILTADGEVGYR